jgi:hypothetical protein
MDGDAAAVFRGYPFFESEKGFVGTSRVGATQIWDLEPLSKVRESKVLE